ncbi:MAG: SDR family NAD(P)-dependent oxidoreductase [Propionibacteriaceae bacterium]|jgi:NAD(P)-dependent dehydrogenase (short-subunit alcohol dehydrogenase family)|nr:SDR family NAD(P)-dependent oxidoreductase [Propionibacteriaceae bacterium]
MSALSPVILGMPIGPTPNEVAEVVRGRLVVVTGTSRGIGAEVARRLVAVGASVVGVSRTDLSDTNEQRDKSWVTADSTSTGSRGTYTHIALDLRDTSAAEEAARRIVAEHGTPAILVSNAGHSIRRYLSDYVKRSHDLTRTAGVNYLGPAVFALPILEAMCEAGTGHLVSVSTTAVNFPLPGWSVYSASKGAYDLWLDAVAPELALDSVAVTSIRLPRVATAMSAPTAGRYPVPELSVPQAAGVVCHGLVRRPRYVEPWWSRAVGIVRSSAPGLLQSGLALALKMGVRP